MGLFDGMFGTKRAPEKRVMSGLEKDSHPGILTLDGKALNPYGDKNGQELIIVKRQSDGSPKAYDNVSGKEITDPKILAEARKMWSADSPDESRFYYKSKE